MRDLKDLPNNDDWKITVRPKLGEPHRYITSYNPPELMEKANIASGEMYEEWHRSEVRYEEIMCDDAETILVAYGASGRICREVVKSLRAQDYKVGLLRPITLFPFPKQFFEEISYDRVRLIVSVEMSIPGQMVDDIRSFVARRARVEHFGRSGGIVITPGEIEDAVKGMLK